MFDLPVSQPANRAEGEFIPLAPTAYTIQAPARIQVSGATTTFTIPSTLSRRIGLSGEPVIRSELAYIKDEPGFTQYQIDPFVYFSQQPRDRRLPTGGLPTRDSINFVLGIDTNQFIRWLNPVNSFFVSTQFFYKHIKRAGDTNLPIQPIAGFPDHEVLPVPARNVANLQQISLGAAEPDLVRNDADQYLQTLLIATSYRSGTVNPSFTFFYDWSGSLVYIPSVTFLYDPFRFTMQYNLLDSGALRGNSGTSLLRDRDYLLFQFEYVI